MSTGLDLPVPETAATDQRQEQYFVASQWQLVWRKFRRHHLALLGMSILAVLYLLAAFAEFFAPYDKLLRNTDLRFAPPQRIRIFENGRLTAPFVYGYTTERNLKTFREEFTVDESQRFRVGLFVRAGEYRLWGLFKTDLHFFGTRDEGGYVYLLGTERLGRDVLSRIIIASRISLSVGLVGVFIAFILGCLLGGLSGYLGGWVDNTIQRLVEILISVPTIPLWLALSAALPATWSIVAVYFGITVILSLIGWTGLARVVRGKLLEVREADFVLAARIAGKREMPIIREHLLPSFTSYLVVDMSLRIPGMILGETALSFLGFGIRPPAVSLGSLLIDAQNVATLTTHPWMLMPALLVIVIVLCFNFVGDGLRDSADPYH
ncbi:MAG: ABC transporter permease [Spirochaetaceae bacterium]|nr:ABC transporter permease [Spirochaetaceae bacterium]